MMLGLSLLVNIVNRDEQLAVPSVAPWLDLGLMHDGERSLPSMNFLKDIVHFLQRSVRSLRKEEIYRRHNYGVDDGKDCVSMILDIGECNRGNHDNLRMCE